MSTSITHSTTQSTNPTAEELAVIALAFAPSLADGNLRSLLQFLNGLTEHRFTGVYRFEPGWVVSVALWDRENPAISIGANVKMKESYCWLTGLGEASYVIEDAPSDPRLQGHVARDEVRSYVAVLLRDTRGTPWGTLCHFDFKSRGIAADALAKLEIFRPLVEEMLIRDTLAVWEPDAPSDPRSVN